MKKQRTIFILGIITAIMPFLGFPNSWRKLFFVLLGLSISYFAYLLYMEKKGVVSIKQDRSNTYTDNRNETIKNNEEAN